MLVTVTASATSSSSPSSDGGLKKGAQIGIGVGLGVGGLIAIIIAAFFILKRRRRRSVTGAGYEKPELHGKVLPKTHGRDELEEGRPLAELEPNTGPRELPGDEGRVEELNAGSITNGKGTSTTMTEEKTPEAQASSREKTD